MRYFNNKKGINNYEIGSDMWLIKETHGSRIFDKIIISVLKVLYVGFRIIVTFFLGKKVNDKFWIRKNITFRGFLYRSVEILKLDKFLLLVFYASKYDFKFYSRVTNKINNFLIDDMYKSMYSHEDDIVERFSPRDGDVVVDIGAGFGFYSILASKKVTDRGRVIAIEPQKDCYDMLNLNIKLNKLNNVATLNYAAYSKAIKLRLYSSYSILAERSEKNKTDFVEVDGNTLDNLLIKLNDMNQVNWIKIDVEGAELEVLKGAQKILSNSQDLHILVEVHGEDNFAPLVRFLEQYNFKLEFKKDYEWGDKHLVLRKNANRDKN